MVVFFELKKGPLAVIHPDTMRLFKHALADTICQLFFQNFFGRFASYVPQWVSIYQKQTGVCPIPIAPAFLSPSLLPGHLGIGECHKPPERFPSLSARTAPTPCGALFWMKVYWLKLIAVLKGCNWKAPTYLVEYFGGVSHLAQFIFWNIKMTPCQLFWRLLQAWTV